MPDLETVDVAGVEILSAGGPVHGVGSPPGGDYWSKKDLEAIAAANVELAGELQPPNKIGHSDAQALLLNSGMAAPTPGEMPAVGWLDGTTFRVEERDGVAKLLADAKSVPKQFADLLKAKAYSTRSVELSRVASQEIQVDGKPKIFDWVVTGLAWLGAKLPAVRTLDDIVALYEHEEVAMPEGARVYVVYAAGDVVWDPEAGFQDLRDDVSEALNGLPTGGMNEPRFWVADIATTLDKALVQDYYDDGDDGYVVPFTLDANGDVTISPSSDWTSVEQGWVETSREFEARRASRETRADIRRVPTNKTYTEEQKRTFAEATGVELDKVTDEMLATVGVPVEGEEPKVDPTKNLEADERFRSLEARVEDEAKKRRDLETELGNERRDTWLEHDVLRAGKDTPGRKADIEKMYEANPQATREFYASAPANEQWAREYGADNDEILTDDAVEAQNKAYEAEAATRLGIPEEAVI